MKLLKFEGYKLVIEPELLTLKPFRKIWTRDKSPNKEKAILELGFIYHFCDPRSDYDYIMDLEKTWDFEDNSIGLIHLNLIVLVFALFLLSRVIKKWRGIPED